MNKQFLLSALLLSLIFTIPTFASDPRYQELADIPFPNGYPSESDITRLKDEIFFQRAVQGYIWSLPALSMMAMKEGFAKTFGDGYNVMPIWKDRLNARTKVTTPIRMSSTVSRFWI